jgi:hypothetical protein
MKQQILTKTKAAIILSILIAASLFLSTSAFARDPPGPGEEIHYEDVDILLIGRCRTVYSTGRWDVHGLYIGSESFIGIGGLTTRWEDVDIRVRSASVSDEFIDLTNISVGMRNVNGIFFWAVWTSNPVRTIPPRIIIRCHAEDLWIRGEGWEP